MTAVGKMLGLRRAERRARRRWWRGDRCGGARWHEGPPANSFLVTGCLFARGYQILDTYIPFVFELLEIPKLSFNGLVLQYRLVLLQQPVADIGVFGLGDGVFGVVFFEAI